jgi:hypothetical protein
MNNILSLEDYLFENESPIFFTNEQINESLEYLSSEDPALMEAWYNTVLDFAALIPGVGSVAEGINLVSYAKQGEYLLAGLCAIGLIPLFGQYIGAGGSLLVKALGKGKALGSTLLKPLINTIAKFTMISDDYHIFELSKPVCISDDSLLLVCSNEDKSEVLKITGYGKFNSEKSNRIL